MMNKETSLISPVSIEWFGVTEFKSSMEIMDRAAQRALHEGTVSLLGFEYDRLITLGLRANEAHQGMILCADTPIYKVNRGGLATLHNLGQTVIYPIVPIKHMGMGARAWVDLIHQITSLVFIKCNIIIDSTNNGVFSPFGKLASIGINIQKGISTHGVSMNVHNDLEDFKKIVPCGTLGQPFDKIDRYKPLTTQEVFSLWCDYFIATLNEQMPRVSLDIKKSTLVAPPNHL